MRASHNFAAVAVMFDEDNLVPNAGLVAPELLAQRLVIAERVGRRVRLDRDRPGAANRGTKALTVLGAMLAGADSINDVDVLRSGAAAELFDDTRAPRRSGPGCARSAGTTCASWTRSAAKPLRRPGPSGWARPTWPDR